MSDVVLDHAPRAERDVSAALSIVLDRVDHLSSADRGHYYRLLEARHEATEKVELDAIDRVLREILEQAPVCAVPLAPEPGPRTVLAQAVGDEVRSRREAAGLTQSKLAELTGIPQSHISRLENAEHSAHRYTLEKIAAALGVTVSELDPTTTG